MVRPVLVLVVLLPLLLPVPVFGRDYGQVRAVVTRVCDGDTVVADIPDYPEVICKSIRIRLRDYNAAELGDPDPARRQEAWQAKAALAALLPPGTEVLLTHIRRDKYFRLDAVIRLHDADVVEQLRQRPR